MAKQKAAERKRGRPPLPPKQRKRNNVTIRLRDDLKSSLQEAGALQGRSLSEEIEFRLERSLLIEDHLIFLSGDPKTASFAREMLEAKKLIETHQEKSIWDDFECHEAMKAAFNRLLTQNAPNPTRNLIKKRADYERYKKKALKLWKDRGGEEFSGNLDADSQPTLKQSPDDLARALGRVAADVVRQGRLKTLAVQVIDTGKPEEGR